MAFKLVVIVLCMLSIWIPSKALLINSFKPLQSGLSLVVRDRKALTQRGLLLAARGRSSGSDNKMPRGVKKEHLPSKICVVCERPFTWRKKWERCWDEVTTCSKSCNTKRRAAKGKDSDGEMNLAIAEVSDGKAF